MSRVLRWYDAITINIYWFALNTRSQTLSPLVIPLLVQQFVGEASKGSALGNIRLWALMTAVLIQALMGILSDRSTFKLGRRRPFILIGTLGEILVFVMIGYTASLEGTGGLCDPVRFIHSLSHRLEHGTCCHTRLDPRSGAGFAAWAVFWY